MKRILTAITAATLAVSLLAQATPAAAVTGFDSAYAGESAFLNLTGGDLGTFTVFFVNTGTATWTRGTSTQVDLAVCLENKTTCNVSSPATAGFNNGWLSSTRYASHTQTSVAPGQAATFTYSIRVPLSVPAGVYTFNGAVVVSATGADVHNEGYYQAATVAVLTQSAQITSIDPTEGSVSGGDNVVITGQGFLCSPAPTVKFGTKTATILSCGATSLTAVSPSATAAGDVDVTVTNAGGAGASNAKTFTYLDDVAPTFESISVESQNVTLVFSEPVCANATIDDPTDISIKVNGTQADWIESSITAPVCGTDSAEASWTLQLDPADETVVEGDGISVTVTSTGAASIEDESGNAMEKARTRTADASADETPPTMASAEPTDDDTLVVTWNEVVDCGNADDAFTYKPESGSTVTATNATCNGTEEVTLTFAASTFDEGDEGTLTYDPADIDAADRVEDTAGNAADGQSIQITPLTAPIITSAEATTASGFTAVAGDVITLAFDQTMEDDNTRSMQLLLTDTNGTKVVVSCGGDDGDSSDGILSATCAWNTDDDSVELTLEESSTEPGNVGTAGSFAGLQWTATIEDAVGWQSVAGITLDVDASTDVKVER